MVARNVPEEGESPRELLEGSWTRKMMEPLTAWMTLLRRTGTEPNFWCTPSYIVFKNLQWTQDGPLWGWKERGESEWFFPPWNTDCHMWKYDGVEVFAGWPGLIFSPETYQLDNQYVYDPTKFLDLSGNKWKVYRRNVRKYPKRVEGDLVYRFLAEEEGCDEIEEMLIKWAAGKEIEDPEVMVRFLLYGELRWGLFLDNRLVGVNVADENDLHIIYRYCLDDGTPFLNEYMRHLFYTSRWVQASTKLVNDGGDLGNDGLAKFKWKLGPYSVSRIFTTRKEGQDEDQSAGSPEDSQG